MKYIYIILCFYGTFLNGQSTYIIHSTFGHNSNNAYMVEELDERLYIIGSTLEISQYFYPFVITTPINELEFSDPVVYIDSTLTMAMNLNNITYFSDSIIRFNTFGSDIFQILEYHTNTNNIELFDSLDLNKFDFFVDSYLYTSEKSILLCGSSTLIDENYDRSILQIDGDSLRLFIDQDSLNRSYFHRLIPNTDSTFLAFGNTRNLIDTSSYTEVIEFNYNLEKNWTYRSPVENIDLGDAIIDSDGNILFTTFNINIDNNQGYFPQFQFIPRLEKLTARGEFLWSRTMGNHAHGEWQDASRWTNIIESHEKDGYILAGSDFERFTGVEHDTTNMYATLAKFSKNGDSLWYRKFSSISDTFSSYHKFWDMIKTSDGGYCAVGYANYADNRVDSILTNTLIVKTDKDGLVYPDTSTHTQFLSEKLNILIYPNPAQNQVIIDNRDNVQYEFTICDLTGSVLCNGFVGTQSVNVLDISSYPDGILNFQFKDMRDGAVEVFKVINH